MHIEPVRWMSIEEDVDAVLVRNKIRRVGKVQCLTTAAIEALATAASEIVSNILVHSGVGELKVEAVQLKSILGVKVIARDNGPGIQELHLALQDGYSTASGLGLGLPSARRLVDEFLLESSSAGTLVVMSQWAR